MNILVGEWDDYWSLMNNYYLYANLQRYFHLIPYDYDNTFGIDWLISIGQTLIRMIIQSSWGI
jgi:spore coat protein CotH